MDGHFYDCADCGTENCPCYLAATGDCLVCSRLAGRGECDCDWKGVCVYNEFIQGGGRVQLARHEFSAPVAARKKYKNGIEVLVLTVGRGFALRCTRPGAYVFLRRPEDERFFDLPISVLAADVAQGQIHCAVQMQGAKSKRVLESGSAPDVLTVRGVYRNGILGMKELTGARGCVDRARKIMIVAKGVGFAPAAHLLRWIGGNAPCDLYLDNDKSDEKWVAEYLPDEMDGSVHSIDLAREFACKGTERVSALYREGGYDALVVLASDYYIKKIQEILPVTARSNNFRLCCGEGICGACSYTDDFGRTFKMCKCERDVTL